MFQLTIQEFDFMKKIILLKHDSLNHDSKILGLFYADDIVNIIKYYSHLPGFSSNTSGFDISKSICSNNNFAFLLQIWNKNDDEEVILEELFANKEAANIHLKKYSDENDMSQKSYQIEKYVVNQKYWIDGYITC